jgi:PPIC-type PPIASE domain
VPPHSLMTVSSPGSAGEDVNQTTVVARVGTSPITAAQVMARASRLPPATPSGDPLADRRARIAPVVHARLYVLEAEARGYDDEGLRRALARFEREQLVAELERVEIRERITVDPALAAEATRRAGLILHLRQIVTESAPEAETLRARTLAGEPFADLARVAAKDSSTAAAGGALPPVSWGSLPPALEEIAYRMQPREIAGPFPIGEGYGLLMLDSVVVRGADPESLATAVTTALADAEFYAQQVAFLDTMKTRLHYSVSAPARERFLLRMAEYATSIRDSPPAAGEVAGHRLRFTPEERALPLFTYDGGRFTIGDYADYLAPESPDRVVQRAAEERMLRDLDQYFRHHAYAAVAESRGYGAGLTPEIERARERALIERLIQAEMAQSPFDPAERATVEEARMAALLDLLEERYPVTYDDAALARLPL